MSQSTSKPAPTAIYVGGAPDTPLPLVVRLEMRADKCTRCDAKVLVHAAGFRAARKAQRQQGVTVVLVCKACAESIKAEHAGPVEEGIVLPPGFKRHFAHE